MLPQNDVCDDEYVEQYQEYDVRYHGVLSHSLCGRTGTVQEQIADVNSPIENNANECGSHTHIRSSYRFEPYHIMPTTITRETSPPKPQAMRGNCLCIYLTGRHCLFI